jgi:hypothetical protein
MFISVAIFTVLCTCQGGFKNIIITRIEQFADERIVDHIHLHGQRDTIHTHSKFTYSHNAYTRANPGCELVELRSHSSRSYSWVKLRNIRYGGACCHPSFYSLRIRLESVTSRAFRVMQCLPIVAVRSILCWNQLSDRQKRGRQNDYGNGNETAKFAKNHQILSRIKVRWETLMGFWRQQIIMSILAECQPFAHGGLGETRAKPPASGPLAWA